MRVLRIGSSLDSAGSLPAGTRAREIAARMLEEACGEPVETVVKVGWPTSAMPGHVARWLDEIEPDLVCLCVSAYWVETETVQVRLAKLGRLGRMAARAIEPATTGSAATKTAAFQAARRLARATVGASPNFQPLPVAEVLLECVRVVVRREGPAVGVAGTVFSPDSTATKAARRRAAQRRAMLVTALTPRLDELRVPYRLPAHAPFAFDPAYRTSDLVHFNERGHAIMGEIDGSVMVAAWKQTR